MRLFEFGFLFSSFEGEVVFVVMVFWGFELCLFEVLPNFYLSSKFIPSF